MSFFLNIGLSNIGHLSQQQAIKIAFHMIGGLNIKEHKVFGESGYDVGKGAIVNEPAMVIELFTDIHPGVIHRVSAALNQDCIAYYNGDEDFGLLIGPKPYDRFEPRYFLMMDGLPLNGELKKTVTAGERLMPGCECGAAANGDFQNCRCD